MLIDEHMALEKIMRILLILFVLVPIIEMWVLIEVGSKIGALPTIGLVLLTACLGLALLRRQGAVRLRARKRSCARNKCRFAKWLMVYFLRLVARCC